MTIKNPGSGPDTPEESDSLSATGMFLRAFNAEPKTDPASTDPFAGLPSAPSTQPDVRRPATPAPGAGEFTQMFQKVDSRPPVTSAAETPFRPSAPTPPVPTHTPGEQAANSDEFTRIFVGGAPPPSSASARNTDEASRPAPALNPSRAKGFSSPGVSGSASGEGSFTQVFKNASSVPTNSPAVPSPAPAPPPSSRSAWDNDPIFRSPQNPPPAEPASPSVTSLLASLGPAGGSPPGGRTPATTPYRPESMPYASPVISREPAEVEAGGVTRLIQRLAQTPTAPAAPPAQPAMPASSGPGEFTRMISRMGSPSPTAEPPGVPQAAPPPPAPHAALPPMPAMAAPAIPAAPRLAPPPAPATPAVPIPAALKPPASALAAPKSKLEAMVPILLVINTFLLLVLLIVVIFLIKSR